MQNEKEHKDRGAFFPDGSYDPEASPVFRKGTHRLVLHLIGMSRLGKLTPEDAARIISEADGFRAFPSVKVWQTGSQWPLMQAETSAEEAVKRSGYASQGERHWCNGYWICGAEKECSNQRHRSQPTQQEIQALTETLGRAFG